MKLKLLASLVIATGLASAAHAATTYNVLGTQSYSIDAVTWPVSEGGLGGVLTQNPNPPTFDGSWVIDAAAPSLAGSFIFQPYTVSVDLSASVGGVVNLSIPSRVLTLSGGTYSYDAVSRTLTGTGIDFLESSPGVTCEDGATGFCSAVPGPSSPSHGSIALTFAENLLSFTGSAQVRQVIEALRADSSEVCLAEGGDNPCANNELLVSGVADVPVPAAAWLFGSAALGLAGLKRRKAA